mmetsp:Transcript_23639/g.32260  ORF Transcript_23639/g.32260 Transcript_23639/m.32260 type:complete len:255 (+) Transcript_23639:64-828(+)
MTQTHPTKRVREASEKDTGSSLVSNSALQGDRRLHCDLLQRLEQQDPDKRFSKPVDDNLHPEYRSYVEHPIDFSVIADRIVSEEGYASHSEFITDVDRVFINAVAYYPESGEEFKKALELRHFWEELLVESGLKWGDGDTCEPPTGHDVSDETSEDEEQFAVGEDWEDLKRRMMAEAEMPIDEVLQNMQEEGRSKARWEKSPSGDRVEELSSETTSDSEEEEESDMSTDDSGSNYEVDDDSDISDDMADEFGLS